MHRVSRALYSTARNLSRKMTRLSKTRSHLLNEKHNLSRKHMNTSRISHRIKMTEVEMLKAALNSATESRKKSHPMKGGKTRKNRG